MRLPAAKKSSESFAKAFVRASKLLKLRVEDGPRDEDDDFKYDDAKDDDGTLEEDDDVKDDDGTVERENDVMQSPITRWTQQSSAVCGHCCRHTNI